MKYKIGMHTTQKKGGNFIPSTYKELMGDNECGGKEPQKGMKLNFKKHNHFPANKVENFIPPFTCNFDTGLQ